MKEIPNYYSVIPAEVRYDNNLRDKSKLLFGEISSLCNKDGCCYATNQYFAELYKVSKTTISILIKELVDNGYIISEIEYKEGTKEILNRYLRIVKGGYLRKLKGGIKENLKDNNTSINNTSINNKYIVEQVVIYLNEKCKTNYRCTTNKTKELIKARLNEGFSLDDFKKVIDIKTNEWLNTKMEQYLRPETLFGTKFESYLNQKQTKYESKSDEQFELLKGIYNGTIKIN